MELIENVIKGLECCLPMTTRSGFGDCKNCPYDRKITFEGGICECCHELMMDALELVKGQEPEALDAQKQDSDVGCWYDITHNYTLEQVVSALKAQEPVKPTVEHNLAGQPMWCCGNCGTTLFFKFPRQTDDEDQRSEHRFCHYCGRKVKWE